MPKAASTSVEAALKEHCDIVFSGHPKVKHIDAQTYSSNIRPLLPHPKRIESFCLIRSPLEWLESWYRYRSRKELMAPESPNHKNYTGHLSYDEFVTAYLSEATIRPTFARLQNQYKFVQLRNGAIGVDRIFCMDRLDLVSEYLSHKIGRDVSIDFKNRSPKRISVLDPKIKKKLKEHLVKDIALYEAVRKNGELTQKSININ
jgi:hypothetical protein